MEIEGSVVLVTGAARRVGRAIAARLAREGARLAIHYNASASEARAFARELGGRYRAEAEAFGADLRSAPQIARLARRVVRRFGRVDVLVNNASTYYRTPLGTVTEAQWRDLVDVNLRAPFFLSQELGPRMQRAGRGKIVNIADWAGVRPYAAFAPYCAAKAGLINLTASLAKGLAPEVQVNAVLPGPVLPPPGIEPKEREAIRRATLVQRLGSPEDVAAAVAFLIESDFITGASLPVDGGRLAA